MYDVTCKDSFANLKGSWLRELTAVAPDTMLKFVVANKVDLVDEAGSSIDGSFDKSQIVTDKMMREFALSKKADCMRVSAKKNTGIDEVF